MKNNETQLISNIIKESSKIIYDLQPLTDQIQESIAVMTKCINDKKKIVIFGNGGSAADSQHIVAELIGKFKIKRKSYPAIDLSSNSSILTSLSNDFTFEISFSRQCECLVNKNDVVIGISTSGNSKNIKDGIIASKKNGAITIGLLGNNGGLLKKYVDIPIIVPSKSTPRIQEAHRVIYHIICELVEKKLNKVLK